ncbi:MAG: DNA-processing protein DprA [Victivallales bacterium]|nr:DNA-processing protein DprA [Victivallales bacterium]
MTDKEALIILNMLSGVGPVKVAELAAALGTPSAILAAKASVLSSIQGIGPKLAHEIADWEKKICLKDELSLAERAKVRIITRDAPEYSENLSQIYDSPLVLYVKGEIPDGNMLGVVGSRRITSYGRRMAEHLAASASFAGWSVVSGLAYGIDAVAHQSTVDAGGRTVAVLGGGLARVHPQDHVPLARKIIETGGAVVSEFSMEYVPNKRSFPMRNRIISGLSHGLLVVEAGFRSGSLITAKCALEQGRMVFAVPGEADNPQARGCNSLIRDGAKLTENFDDILDEFEFLPGMRTNKDNDDGTNDDLSACSADLTDAEREIVEFVSLERDVSADRIIAATGVKVATALSLLMGLELKGILEQRPGKRYAPRTGSKKH